MPPCTRFAHGAFNRLRRGWKSQKYSFRLKLRLFQSSVLSLLLHMSKTWHLNQQQEKKIHSFENTCLRRILNINWTQRIRNDTIRQQVQLPLITDVIRQRRWHYLGQDHQDGQVIAFKNPSSSGNLKDQEDEAVLETLKDVHT